ncbi:hypothetical protein UlMin_038728 [Ulmus minor]
MIEDFTVIIFDQLQPSPLPHIQLLLSEDVLQALMYRHRASCLGRKTSLAFPQILDTAFPGNSADLENYPSTFPKRVLRKLVPISQIEVFGLVMDVQKITIFMRLMTPPPSYYSLRTNIFGNIAPFRQSTGDFKMFLNNEMEGRFPGEIEFNDSVDRRLVNSIIDHAGVLRSKLGLMHI